MSSSISNLTALTSLADDDVFVVDDVSANTTKKVTKATLATLFGGLSRIQATSGAADDSNMVFGFDSEPTYLNINGALYPKGVGIFNWSWSGGTVTLAYPVGTGGFIEGLV